MKLESLEICKNKKLNILILKFSFRGKYRKLLYFLLFNFLILKYSQIFKKLTNLINIEH